MSAYDELLSDIKRMARERAEERLRSATTDTLGEFRVRIQPRFSEADKSRYIAEAEEVAVGRLNNFMIGVALDER